MINECVIDVDESGLRLLDGEYSSINNNSTTTAAPTTTTTRDGLSSFLLRTHQQRLHRSNNNNNNLHCRGDESSAGNYFRFLATSVTESVKSTATKLMTYSNNDYFSRTSGSFERVDREDPLLLVNEQENENLHNNGDNELGGGGGGSTTTQQAPSQPPPRQFLSFSLQRPLLHPDNRRAAFQYMRRLGDYLAYLTLLTMLVVIPVVLYRALSLAKVDLAAWNSAGVMACGTVILSSRQVYLHLTHWYMPEVQKYVVRILWMVPIYSVQSWLSLRFHNSRIYIDTVRDLYEAYVIASFVYYLIELLGGQDALVHILLQKRDTELGQHPFPLRLFLQRWELGVEFMLQCKHGVLQYVVFKIVATLLTYFCEMAGLYGEGNFSWKVAYPYLCFFQNISVMYALYSLVMLYSAVKEELEYPVDWRPLGKFLCIKGVVFFTWWQGVIIFYLREHGIIGNVGDWSSRDVAYGLIDYCIVIEMVGFAIAHSYTFTYKEYLPGSVPSRAELMCQHQQQQAPQPPPMQQQQHQALLSSCGGGGGDNADDEDCMITPPPPLTTMTTSISGFSIMSSGSSSNHHYKQHSRNSSYRPPATLEQPMKFREALWSSTMPRETIQDIQRLRTGFDNALQEQKVRLLMQQQQQQEEDTREQPQVQQQQYVSSGTSSSNSMQEIMLGDCSSTYTTNSNKNNNNINDGENGDDTDDDNNTDQCRIDNLVDDIKSDLQNNNKDEP